MALLPLGYVPEVVTRTVRNHWVALQNIITPQRSLLDVTNELLVVQEPISNWYEVYDKIYPCCATLETVMITTTLGSKINFPYSTDILCPFLDS